MERKDDFAERRKHLASLSDEELYQRFWQLTEEAVKPLIELAETHTSPSIERSVLLRMGLDSMEAKELVKKIGDRELLGKGAGHVLWRLAEDKGLSIREAAEALLADKYWDEVEAHWGGGKNGLG